MLLAALCWASPATAQTLMVARTEAGEEVVLPLVEESVRVAVDQQHATTVVRHVYENRTGRRVEGRFVFRAGEGANIDGFAYWNGGQKIVGEVMEKGAARQIYEGTVTRRRDPGLLEKTGDGSFSFRVFPIEPGEKKRVEIRYDQWLRRRDRSVELRVPLATAAAEVGVTLRDDRGIRRLSSATHDVATWAAGRTEADVQVGAPRGDRVRELAIQYELGDRHFKLSAHAHGDLGENGYAVISLAAPPLGAHIGQDLTLVLDASSSMAGAPYEQARFAAMRIVDRLHAADRVNVVIASSPVQRLYETPRWVTRETRADVRALLEKARRPRAGAGLAQALAAGLAVQDVHPRPKTLLVLSDGRSDARRALELADRDTTDARVFTLGFGPAVDQAVLSRLAAQKRGHFELVESAESIPGRVDKLGPRLAVPVLRKISLEGVGADLFDVYPRVLPDLHPGQEVVVVARVRGSGPARVVLRARGAEPITLSAALDRSAAPPRPWIGKLWGRQRVQHLLEEIAARGPSEDRLSETIELALAYNIVTPYTSFLAIPESELSAEAARSLASARQRKQAILALNPDAAALLDPAQSAAPPSGGAPAMAEPSPMDAPASAPSSPMEIHGGGCAGCRVAPHEGAPWELLGAALAAALALSRRRRRV